MDEPQNDGDVERMSERLEKSLCMDTDNSLETYNRLVKEAKDVARGGDMHRALQLFKKAFNIQQSDKLRSRIQRIEELLAENESENEDEDFVDVHGSGLLLYKGLYDKLYDYQKQGVAFLYSLYRDNLKGGILADDMGLGKTIQVISFLSGMYDAEHIKSTMLVVPTSLITNWINEFTKWTPGIRVKEYHGTSKSERMKNLDKVQRRSGVLITTYNMLLNNWQILASYHGREFTWDYMILDEAHKIKSSTTKTAKSASAIPSKNRVLLTGTPVQNNLREMWALFDFACQGRLLGTSKTFKVEYENPITRAREKDATPGEKALGSRMSENLMATIGPYFLRRTKAEVQKQKWDSLPQLNGSQDSERTEESSGAMMPKLTRKNDLIVWTYLSEIQEDIYRQFLSLDQIKELLMTTKSPLAQLTVLKKLCDHPRLLSAGAMAKLGLDENETGDSETDSGHDIANVPDDALISESGKMVFLIGLLERLREEGHRTLVFAHFRKVLDILERILNNRGFKVMRMDGTITQTAEREKRITRFQKDNSYNVFLLTTQVGGVGITLTAANRVVIYDPSWNPATDAQAVDRAYRIGQKENVVIYRLITCGTVEEKIYRRQVFKDSLIRQNTGDKKNPFRYFSKQELKELFTLEDTRSSTTQLQLQALHSQQRRTDTQLDEHIAHLHTMEMFGISDHDLMFSLNVHQEEALQDQEEHRYIEGRVQKAQQLVKAESELQMQLAQSMASSTEAAWLRVESHPPRERRHRSPKQVTESPPAPSYHRTEGVVDLENSALNVSEEKNMIDLTIEQNGKDSREMSPVLQEELHKIKTERGESEQNEEVVISDDEVQDNGFHHSHNIKQERPDFYTNGDMSMKDESNELPELQNGNLSFNHLVIEDSVEEIMDMTAQKSLQNSEQKGSKNIRKCEENGQNRSVNGLCDSAEEKANHRIDQSTGDDSLTYYTPEEILKPQLNNSQANAMDVSDFHGTPLKNKRLSVLQSSFKSQHSSKSSLDSLNGDFNLQLDEDSDMFSDHNIFNDEKKMEAAEMEMLSKLQLEGSFDVDKSLAEHHNKERSRVNGAPEASANESIVFASRKKRVARIYSDDEDEEDEEKEDAPNGKEFESSFHMLEASTPIAASAKNRSRSGHKTKPVGANTSVASLRSLVLSLIDDVENQEEEESRGGVENGEMNSEGEEEEEESEEMQEESEEEEDRSRVSEAEEDKLQEEEEEETEPSGETLGSETEEEEEEEDTQESVEEATGDAELSSNEQMEAFTAEADPDDYDWLVKKGREHFDLGQREEALSYFLRAIDMKPGDPVIQMMTIQLYRQLSQRK